MFANLSQINQELGAWAGGVRRGASASELAMLSSRAHSSLGYKIPRAYADLLIRSNGVNFLFMSIYGTHSFRAGGCPDKKIAGFMEANLKWRNREGFMSMIVFGDTMNELHVFNTKENAYQTVDSMNARAFETYSSAKMMFSEVLQDGLC